MDIFRVFVYNSVNLLERIDEAVNKGRIKAVLLIVVFLLVVAVICSWLTGTDKKD